MSAHAPGSHTREVDLAALRAWIKAGRPAEGPRDWYYRTWPQARHHRAGPDRWVWWPTLIIVAVVMGGMLALSMVHPIEQRVARWCSSCHATVELQPDINWGN